MLTRGGEEFWNVGEAIAHQAKCIPVINDINLI